jgi:hypothetical protein
MIRADSTLADARYRLVFHKASRPIAQRTGRPRLFGAETFEEGIGGDGWGDRTRGHPASNSSQDWPGPPHDAGRTRLGPSQYIGSQESRDSSTTVSINSFAFPQHSSHRRAKGDQPDAREGWAGPHGVATWRLGDLSTPQSVQKLRTALHAKAMGELLRGRNRQQGVIGRSTLTQPCGSPVVALQAQSQGTRGRELPLSHLYGTSGSYA